MIPDRIRELGNGVKALTYTKGRQIWTDIYEDGEVVLTVESGDYQQVSDQAIGFFKGRQVGRVQGQIEAVTSMEQQTKEHK